MDPNEIAALLKPFLEAKALPAPAILSSGQLAIISTYVDLLLRWNARINLTAIHDLDDVITRHFGESLFLAAYPFPNHSLLKTASQTRRPRHALDLGSGAGFPGLPLKIYAPDLQLTLVESSGKKAAFLSEAIRALQLSGISVFGGRLDSRSFRPEHPEPPGAISPPDLVTMRAVERFESALATAAALGRYGSARLGAGKLALLLGLAQAERVPELAPEYSWETPVPVPQSRQRVLLVGRHSTGQVSRE